MLGLLQWTRKQQFLPVGISAYRFVPFAVETCRCIGKQAVWFASRLRGITTESGRIPKDACARWARLLLSVTVQRGNDVAGEC